MKQTAVISNKRHMMDVVGAVDAVDADMKEDKNLTKIGWTTTASHESSRITANWKVRQFVQISTRNLSRQ